MLWTLMSWYWFGTVDVDILLSCLAVNFIFLDYNTKKLNDILEHIIIIQSSTPFNSEWDIK
jgi:hypothetical protein